MNSEKSHVFPRISNCDKVCIATNAAKETYLWISGEKSRISYCDKALRFALQQILLSHLLMVIYYGKDTVEKSQGYPTLRRFATNARYQFRCLVVSDCRSSFIFSIFYLTWDIFIFPSYQMSVGIKLGIKFNILHFLFFPLLTLGKPPCTNRGQTIESVI